MQNKSDKDKHYNVTIDLKQLHIPMNQIITQIMDDFSEKVKNATDKNNKDITVIEILNNEKKGQNAFIFGNSPTKTALVLCETIKDIARKHANTPTDFDYIIRLCMQSLHNARIEALMNNIDNNKTDGDENV